MNASLDWKDHVPERDGIKSSVNEVAFSPGNDVINVLSFYYVYLLTLF